MDESKRLARAAVVGVIAAMGGMRHALMGAAAVLAVTGAAATVGADVRSITPKFVTIARDNTAMRCADGGHFYPVRMLRTGEVLRADGEGSGWVRVAYPAGTRAYVGAAEGTFEAGTKTFRLTRGSKMMAANEGGAAPWWPLLEKDVGPGTALADAEPVRAADGTVQGYLVAAPSAARGFVRAEMTRAATAEEAARGGGGPVAARTPEMPRPEPVRADAPKPVPAGAAPETAKPVETAKGPETGKTEGMRPDGARTDAGNTPPPDAGEIVEMKPDAATNAPEPRTTKTTTMTMESSRTPSAADLRLTQRVDDLNVLRDLFDRAMQRSESESEVQTVINEFNRKITALPMSGDDGKVRVALEQRRDALKMRQEILETKRQVSAGDGMDERMRQVRVAIEQANRQAIYTIVGRILPSTVYDGKRGMALMYRIESADISSTRTIGYVVPRDGAELLSKMGKIVGIVGEAKMDPALQLNIVAPVRVDELQFSGGKLETVPGGSGGATPGAAPMNGSPGTPSAPVAPGSVAKPVEGGGQPIATPGIEPGEPNK